MTARRAEAQRRREGVSRQSNTSQNSALPTETRTFLGDGEPALSNQFSALREKSGGHRDRIKYSVQHCSRRPYNPPMTRARKASNGVVTPPPLDRWIDAVLMLCVSLVQGVGATLGMWRRAAQRDWHTQSGISALPQATSGIQLQDNNHTHGVILGQAKRDPRIPVGSPRGLSIDPLDTRNQDARVKPEHDSVAVAPTRSTLVIPGEGAQRRRPGTQGRQAQASRHAVPGFRLAHCVCVRIDTVSVR